MRKNTIILSTLCLETGTDIQLALYYLAAYYRAYGFFSKQGARVRIRVFSENESPEIVARAIASYNPVIIGFSCYVWNIQKIIVISRLIKIRFPSVVIVLGGPEVSPRPAEILRSAKHVDYIISGEGEKAFTELSDAVISGALNPLNISGVSFRINSRFIHSAKPAPSLDMKKIPSPYLEGLVPLSSRNIIDVPLETTRGCVYSCRYCYYHKNAGSPRAFPLRRVMRELSLILRSRPREVYIMDATFNADPARAKKILCFFIRHNEISGLHVELRAELLDEEMVDLLARARVTMIEIGVQSVNRVTLRLLRRPFNKNLFARSLALLNTRRIPYEVQFIDCLPGQRYEELKKGLNWVFSLKPFRVEIFKLHVLPGTYLRKHSGEYGIIYDHNPPYLARRSGVMNARELKKTERLRFAVQRLYDAPLFRTTLFTAKEVLKIEYCEIFELWSEWELRFKKRRAGRIQESYFDALNESLPDFLCFLCKKSGRDEEYNTLLPVLKRSFREYEQWEKTIGSQVVLRRKASEGR
ncbi:MAG: radical SAM protein [Candidatus Omnitrophica bacterium]|nr:radical SAM protein [Candidatus Omnitrophota bacterium]